MADNVGNSGNGNPSSNNNVINNNNNNNNNTGNGGYNGNGGSNSNLTRLNSINNTAIQNIVVAKRRESSSNSSELSPKYQFFQKSTASLHSLQNELAKQKRIKEAIEKLIQADNVVAAESNDTSYMGSLAHYNNNNNINNFSQKSKMESRLHETDKNISAIEKKLETVKKMKNQESKNTSLASTRKRSLTLVSVLSDSTTSSSSNDDDDDDDDSSMFDLRNDEHVTESPTWLVGDILASLSEKNREADYLIQRSNDLVILLEHHTYLKEDLVLHAFGHVIQILLSNPCVEVRACGYRIARYLLGDADTIDLMIRIRLETFIIISLSMDNKCLTETEQALKFIRKIIEIPNGIIFLTIGLIKAIIAVAENIEGKLRLISIETICEISLLNPELSFKADALRIIFQCLTEGPYGVSSCCLLSLIRLLDHAESRKFLFNQLNIYLLISPFTDYAMKTHSNIEKLQNNAFMLTVFLKTWPGFISFSQNHFNPLKELINCLIFDIPNLRDILMDIFFDILRIRTLPWIQSITIFGKRNINQSKSDASTTNQVPHKPNIAPSEPEKELRIINHYTSLFLTCLLNCGIMEKLASIITDGTDDLNRRKAIFLLIEILNLSSNLLPRDFIDKIDSFDALLPLLVERNISNNLNIKIPSSVSFQIEKVTRRLNKGRVSLGMQVKPLAHFNDLPKDIKAMLKYEFDDTEFRKLLMDTKILQTKQYESWNWDLIIELCQGPLTDGKRLEDTVKTTKIVKRLMSFYRPFKFRFSKVSKKSRLSAKYIRVGCELFKMLLASEEGVKFLSENKLLPQIAECIAQVDPYSGITATDSLFSKQKLEATANSGYFTMLGVLSKDLSGLKMLEQWRIFSMFYHISERKSGRDDIVKLIIKEMDFKYPSHLRIILSKILTTSDKNMRIFTTKHLEKLLNTNDDPSFEEFVITLLIDQLYDPDKTVCTTAAQILDTYCDHSKENILNVIKLKPCFENLQKIGQSLLIKFLSIPVGFKYLMDNNFVETEMENWINGKIFQYVIDVENLLFNELFDPDKYKFVIIPKIEKGEKGRMPDHFFGELVKTEEGVNLLVNSGLFVKFSKFIKDYISEKFESSINDSNEDPEYWNVLHLKGYLWSLGNIGASTYGIQLLESVNFVEDVMTIMNNSECFSLRGTCFYVLGFISNTEQGMEILDELNWSSTLSFTGNPIGYCLPNELEGFFDNDANNIKKLDDNINHNEVDDDGKDVEKDGQSDSFGNVNFEYGASNTYFNAINGSSKNDAVTDSIALEKFKSYTNLTSFMDNELSLLTKTNTRDLIIFKEIYENLINIMTHLMVTKSISNLNRLKYSGSRKNEKANFVNFFKSDKNKVFLFKIILKLFENFKYKLSTRRYLLNDFIDSNKLLEIIIRSDRKKAKLEQQQQDAENANH